MHKPTRTYNMSKSIKRTLATYSGQRRADIKPLMIDAEIQSKIQIRARDRNKDSNDA